MWLQIREHAIAFLPSLAFGFIFFGGFVALLNWWFLSLQILSRRRGETHSPSMIGAIGALLPLGCLCFPALRIHALWVWLLDPFTASLVLNRTRDIWNQWTKQKTR